MKPLLAPARIQGKAPVDFIAVGGVIAESRPELSFREPGVCLLQSHAIAIHASIGRNNLPDIESRGGQASAPARGAVHALAQG